MISLSSVIARGKALAAYPLNTDDNAIVFRDGTFSAAGNRGALDLFDLARLANDRTLPQQLQGPVRGIGDHTVRVGGFPLGCHVCEVDVDPETGLVTIVRYTAIDDVGKAINPMILHGQTHGGIAQGVGQTIWEQCVYDQSSGQLLSGSLMDYALPRADDLPFFDCERSEVPATSDPLGIRPGGEGGCTPAIAVAIMRWSTRLQGSVSQTSSHRRRLNASGARSATPTLRQAGTVLGDGPLQSGNS